jgi:hypothetical protein
MLSKVSSDGLMTTRPELSEWKVGLSDEDGWRGVESEEDRGSAGMVYVWPQFSGILPC